MPRTKQEQDLADECLRAEDAANTSSQHGWVLVLNQILLAVNPDDSSEVWTYFHVENMWKRKGEEPRAELRDLTC